MSEANPVATMLTGGFDPLLFMKVVHKVGHTGALGLRYLAHGDDWAELVLPANPRHVGQSETIATGPIIGLMDMATSMAIWIVRDRFVPHATLDLRVDRPRSVTPGIDIVGRGTCRRLAVDLAFASGVAHQGDAADPVARLTATFMATA